MGEMNPKTAKQKAPARPRKPRPVAFVRCGGGNKTCDGAPSCGQGCIGCGSCVEACKFGAISMNEHGVAFVNRELCRGCGVCVRKCPKGVIELVDPDRPDPRALREHLAPTDGKGQVPHELHWLRSLRARLPDGRDQPRPWTRPHRLRRVHRLWHVRSHLPARRHLGRRRHVRGSVGETT